MFTGLTTWLGVERDDEVQENEARRRQFSQYVLYALRRRNSLFVNDDIERGRQVIDATIALGNALRVNRERFGLRDDQPLADALVHLVLEMEGEAATNSIADFDSFACDNYVALDTVPTRNVEFDPLSTRIVDAWMTTLIKTSAGSIEGTRVAGTSRRTLTPELYDRWTRESLKRTLTIDVIQAFNITYTALTDNSHEADHGIVARQAWAPLVEQIDIMSRDIDTDTLRLDVTFNVELHHENCDDDDEIITAHCALAYRIYVVDDQQLVVYEGQKTLPETPHK